MKYKNGDIFYNPVLMGYHQLRDLSRYVAIVTSCCATIEDAELCEKTIVINPDTLGNFLETI